MHQAIQQVKNILKLFNKNGNDHFTRFNHEIRMKLKIWQQKLQFQQPQYSFQALQQQTPKQLFSNQNNLIFPQRSTQGNFSCQYKFSGSERTANSSYQRVLTGKQIKPSIINARYAVRGPLTNKAIKYEHQMKEGKKFNFKQITQLNIGNPQQLGQPPIYYNRRVLSCIINPELCEQKVYSSDIIERARSYLKDIQSIGAYSQSQVREGVARFIYRRDNFPSDPNIIFIGNGAGDLVKNMVHLLINHPSDGIMIPIPRYPMYSAEITLREGHMLGYQLDESNNWALTIEELNRVYVEAKHKGLSPKALVVINPGNPTGQVLTRDNIEKLIQFCNEKSILIIADEVYQDNVYAPQKQFHSFKKVMCEMGERYSSNQELVSFHSVSKGITGECGLRGGYAELWNIDKDVQEQFLKLQSIQLCASTTGQIMVDLQCNPPPTLASTHLPLTIAKYQEECTHLFESLKARAQMVTSRLNQMRNITCNEIEGAMYAFPKVVFSEKAILEAALKGFDTVDQFYCDEMLNQTGIVVVPGNGFGQQHGTHHFRITILAYPESKLEEAMNSLHEFNNQFHYKYQ